MSAVTVVAPFQAVHEGKKFLPGETAEVPDDVAQSWIALGDGEAEEELRVDMTVPGVDG